MTIKTLQASQLLNGSYNGEIFVRTATSELFNNIKSFVDTNNLICFIESENVIYAQGHKYSGITEAQAAQIEKITEIETSIGNIVDKLALEDDNKSIIGSLSYIVNEGGEEHTVQAPNVTSFVNTVINAVQAGSIDLANQIDAIEEELNDVNSLLEGFPVAGVGGDQNVKEYIDNQLTNVVSTLSLAIANNATIVVGDNDHIQVTYEATVDEVDPNTGQPISFKAPYIFKVGGYDIASESSLNELVSRINTIFGDSGNKNIQTIIDEELARQLVPEDAQESLDTLQEIAKWIQDHPEDAAAINRSIDNIQNNLTLLSTEWDENKDEFARKGELYEDDGEGGKKLKTTVNGQQYGTTLEEINILLGQMSYAQNVEDNAEQNVIVDIATDTQTVKIKGNEVEFDDGLDSLTTTIQLINASYDSTNRTISLGLNTDALETVLNKTIDIATDTAVAESKDYTNERLSWILVE